MLKIRLSRIGKNQYATFRVVVAEHTRAVKGKAVEILGSYDPHRDTFHVEVDRVKHWIAKGAHVTPTVHNLLIDEKILEGKKKTAWKPPKKASPADAGGPPKKEEPAAATEKPAEGTEKLAEEAKHADSAPAAAPEAPAAPEKPAEEAKPAA